jgi:two-component system CheB/CheR fusion protein
MQPDPSEPSASSETSAGSAAPPRSRRGKPRNPSVSSQPQALEQSAQAASEAIAGEPDRLAEPAGDEQPPRLPFAVVGIGGSAGALEAFTELFKHMPANTGMAFVLVQHLPPDRHSLMADLMSKRTAMTVLEIEDGMPVEPNRVYIIRPGHTLTIRDGHLHLGEPLEKPGHRRPVDDFFRSLAEEQRERAIAIIMSGMDSNGTAGSQAVKAVGGMTIAQDPESAEFPSMPRNMIQAGLADFILAPAEMPEVLIRYAQHPYVAGTDSTNTIERRERQAVNEILAVLRTRTRHDFEGYKKGTIVRRIQRRMGLNQIDTMRDYVRMLRQSQSEVLELSDDLMIHVTGFFRDGDAVWETLKGAVIVPLVQLRQNHAEIRAWVTACSSGEEAYTLAMLLVEAADAQGKTFDIKIFATDTADRSLSHARNGIYAGGIEDEMSNERLARFFDKEDSVYRIKKELRQIVLFAPQNMLQDPPFSRLDICTCRNLLIYLEPEAQQRALALIHFGLVNGGALLLGNSEAIAGGEKLFEPIDKKIRLFRRIGATRGNSREFPILHRARPKAAPPAPELLPTASSANVPQRANRLLLDRYTPAAVVITREQEIVYFHGDTSPYLDQPRGEPTRDLLTLTREACRTAVRTVVLKALGQDAPASAHDGIFETGAGRMRLDVDVLPLEPQPAPRYFLIGFRLSPEPLPMPPPASSHGNGDGKDEHVRQLHEELQRARDDLQSTVEELQTSSEEMKASNEEALSINEELQSANEELETSKEELQSLNEELSTVNAQLQAKMEELEGTSSDLSSLLSSTDIAVLFLDMQFQIRRYTPAVKDLLQLIPADIGRPLRDLNRKFEDDTLLDDAAAVLERLLPVEKEVRSTSDRTYVRRVLPYRTSDNRIGGVVITFVDITARKMAEDALRANESRVAAELEAVNGLYKLTTRLLLSNNLKAAMGEVLDAAIIIHSADMGDIQLLDPKTKTLKFAAARGLSSSFMSEFASVDSNQLSTSSGQALQSGERVIIEDVNIDLASAAHRHAAAETGYRAVQSTPLITRGGELVGMLSTHFRRPHRPLERELLLSDLYARQAADVIERFRTEQAVRENEERLRKVIAIETVGVMFHKVNGLLVDANDAFLRQVGYTRAEMEAGQIRCEDLTPPSWRERTHEATRELRSTGRHAAYEKEFFHRDGSRWWGLVAGTVLGEDDVVEYVVDVTQRRQAEEALQTSEQRFRAMANLVPDLLWQGDDSGEPAWFNQRWLDYTGNTLEELRDRGWQEFVHPDDRERAERDHQAAVAAGAPLRHQKRIRSAGGEYRWFLSQALPVRDAGHIVQWVGAATDIHEQQLAMEAMQQAKEAAESANAAKDQFLANVSHELRTPLAAMLLWAKMLDGEQGRDQGRDPSRLREGLDAIRRSAQAQSELIEDLLDTSRIAAGKMRLELEPTDLALMVRQAVDAIGPAAAAKGAQIESALNPNTGIVRVDPHRLQQVVWNLLSNAVKFTPPGGRIDVGLERRGEEIQLSVRDTGVGLDPAFVPHVFDRFGQAELSPNRSKGGLGLGLSISKQLVEMHGGSIRAVSDGVGKGAAFVVVLPAQPLTTAPAPARPGASRKKTAAAKRLRGTHALLVEEDPSTRAALVSLFQSLGVEVSEADSVPAALAAYDAHRPDLIVSDIHLGTGGDGRFLLQQIRQREAASTAAPVPAIALTASADENAANSATEAGFQQHLLKPVEPQQLIAALSALVLQR